jgi:penicillin-binding protein 2
MVRPHLVDLAQLPGQYRQAVLDTFTGAGEKQVSLDPDTWMTVTEGMAQATQPGLYHTAEGAHLEGIDFAGKTGTAQVVAGGDTHNKGGLKTPNAWFVGMAPRRNPEIAVVVLQEHGDWGSGSAKLAAQVITAYVNKKRRQENNLLLQASKPAAPVEVGAVWSAPGPAGAEETHPSHKDKGVARMGHPISRVTEATGMQGGHFLIPVSGAPTQTANDAPLFPARPANKAPNRPSAPAGLQAEASVGLPERFRGVLP